VIKWGDNQLHALNLSKQNALSHQGESNSHVNKALSILTPNSQVSLSTADAATYFFAGGI
jgi:hypothetical protein